MLLIKNLVDQLINLIIPSPTGDHPVNILIVEDDFTQREILVRLARQKNAIAETVSAIREALTKLEWADILILDWRLQGKDAQVIMDRWADTKYTGPVMIISGYLTPELKSRLLLEGASMVLEKPVDNELILRMAARFIAQVRQDKEISQLREDIYRIKVTMLTILLLVLLSFLAGGFDWRMF